MYKFIHDEKELKNFFNIIVPPLKDFEVFFTSLSCRKKYLSEEERDKYHITRAEMFDRKIIRKKEWSRFLRSIKKYETNEGSYLSKNNLSIPSHCLVIYWNINPSYSLKALKEFQGKIVDWQYEIVNGNFISYKDKFNKIDVELMNCYQRNRGTKYWLDIDFDVPKEFNAPEILSDYLFSKELQYYWVDTKSGYHLLIDRNTLTFNPNDICSRGLSDLKAYFKDMIRSKVDYNKPLHLLEEEIDEKANIECGKCEIMVNKNEMIPLPFCYQGDYPVKVLWEYSTQIIGEN